MIYLLILSILIFAVTSSWAISRVGRMKDKTISQHIAKSQSTRVIFGINGTTASLLAVIVLFLWILPRHHADTFSYIVIALLMIFFIVAALIPQIEGTWRAKIHNIAAWGMCFIIPVVILITLFWRLNELSTVLGLIAFIAICVLLVLFVRWKGLRREFLVFQSIYLSIFFIYLLVLSS